jgi:hypothetical protein
MELLQSSPIDNTFCQPPRFPTCILLAPDSLMKSKTQGESDRLGRGMEYMAIDASENTVGFNKTILLASFERCPSRT